jgi:hypothetical protein
MKSRRRVNSNVRRLLPAMTKRLFILFIIILFAVSLSRAQSSVPTDAQITLERLTDAFGNGANSRLTIKSDGTVTFKRFANPSLDVSDPRAQESPLRKTKIPVETVAALLAEFDRIKFFSLKDRYAKNEDGCPSGVWTDGSAAQISITINGKSKTIFHYHGCLDENHRSYPVELTALELKIDELINTKQWLK